MAYEVQFETTAKQIVELPLIQIGTARMVELEDGRLVNFDDPSNYAKYGLGRWIKTIAVPDPLPEPFNPTRAEAVRTLKEKVDKFPSSDYPRLMNDNRKLKNALDRDFVGTSLEQIQEWTALVESEAERIKEERKRAELPPTFERFQLTRSFRGRYYGDLFIENSHEDGSPQNGWNAVWLCRCAKCEASGPLPRTVRAQTLLEMEIGFRPLYSCEKPCRK